MQSKVVVVQKLLYPSLFRTLKLFAIRNYLENLLITVHFVLREDVSKVK